MYPVAEMEILFGAHLALHALLDIVIAVFFPYDRHTVRTDDTQETLIFIAPWFRDDERDLHVRLLRHAARQTVTRSSQTT